MAEPKDQRGPSTPDDPLRCAHPACRHPRVDHSGRRDGWQSRIVPRRPWCHACDAVCDFEPTTKETLS